MAGGALTRLRVIEVAAGGWLAISPGVLPDPALPPLKAFGQQADFQAGVHAAIASIGAIFAREQRGSGEHVDVSVQACIASNLDRRLRLVEGLTRFPSYSRSWSAPPASPPWARYPTRPSGEHIAGWIRPTKVSTAHGTEVRPVRVRPGVHYRHQLAWLQHTTRSIT